MNFKRLKRVLSRSEIAAPDVARFMSTLDKSVPTFRTVFLIAGLVGAALGVDTADYLFAAGLLLHFSIWFENWWLALRTR
jgi:hypothetical protein